MAVRMALYFLKKFLKAGIFLQYVHIVLVAGSNHNCDSSTQPVVRLCHGASLLNQTSVYIDFTTFGNLTSTDFCSCTLTPRVNGTFKVQPRIASDQPRRGCGVFVHLSQVANSWKSIGCASKANLTFDTSSLPLSITIRQDTSNSNRRADYSCYSAVLENNEDGYFNVHCEDKTVKSLPTSSTTTPSVPPSTTTSSVSPGTTTSCVSPSTTTPSVSPSTTTSSVSPSTTTSSVSPNITVSSAYTTEILKQQQPEDVTPWHIIIPAIAAIFVIIAAIIIGACMIHYRGRRKDMERADHDLRIKNGLDMYNAVDHKYNHTTSPEYIPDDIGHDGQTAEFTDHLYSSANSMKRSVKWDSQTDTLDGYRHGNGSMNEPGYAVVENLGKSREDQNIEDIAEDTTSTNEHLYAEVKKDKKLLDVVIDQHNDNADTYLSESKNSLRVNIEQSSAASPIYAVPDKRKKQRNNELHKSVISIGSEGSKTEYYKK